MLGRIAQRRLAHEERSIDLTQYAQLWSGSLGYSPVPVSVQTAATNAACSAVVDTLATSISQTPIDVFRKAGTRRLEVTPTPPLIDSPSGLVEPDVWMYQLADSCLTDGNGFGEVVATSGLGLPTQIELIDPARVGDRKIDKDGRKSVTIDGNRQTCWPHGDIWHVPGRFVKAGTPFAQSPIERARATIGTAIAARDYGGQFFGSGGHPTTIISADIAGLTEEQSKGIKAAYMRAIEGREPAVLGSDLTVSQIQTSPNDSQFLDLMRFCIEEACRFWRVPPSMVYAAMSGQNVTYVNATQADLAYLKHSVEGHFIRYERAFYSLLPRPQFARFNRSAFLRSDPVTRSEVVDRRLKNQTLTINEARALEDEQPFPGDEYDQPGIPGGPEPTDPPTGGPNA